MTICLTFDTDHMSEVNLSKWLSSVEIEGCATFYCGQKFDILEGTKHLQAPHPDFAGKTNFIELIDEYQKMFPSCKTWRSHSLLFSQSICVELFRRGYTSVSISEQFGAQGIAPNRLPWGPVDMSIYYMDNSDFCNFNNMHNDDHVPFNRKIIDRIFENGSVFDKKKVYVFDFHPIHIALNTRSYGTYAAERDAYKSDGAVSQDSASRYGVKNFYNELIASMKENSVESISIEQAVEEFYS
ncbi:polysaccharide deacetylase WbmS family protein [Bosea thiooxidans]